VKKESIFKGDLIMDTKNEKVVHDFKDGLGPVPAHYHRHGGGLVADSAFVSPTAFIGSCAQVSGTAMVLETAHISDAAHVYGRAVVSGDAYVGGTAEVYDRAIVAGDASIRGTAKIGGFAKVEKNAVIQKGTFTEGDYSFLQQW